MCRNINTVKLQVLLTDFSILIRQVGEYFRGRNRYNYIKPSFPGRYRKQLLCAALFLDLHMRGAVWTARAFVKQWSRPYRVPEGLHFSSQYTREEVSKACKFFLAPQGIYRSPQRGAALSSFLLIQDFEDLDWGDSKPLSEKDKKSLVQQMIRANILSEVI